MGASHASGFGSSGNLASSGFDLRILFVSSSSGSRGGGELYLVYLGQALVAAGHEVTLWVSNHPRMDELTVRFEPFGRVIRSHYRNTYDRAGRNLSVWYDRRTPAYLADEWQAGDWDLVHLNKQNLEDGLDMIQASRLMSKPSVCTIHITQDARYLRARFGAVRDWVSRRILKSYAGTYIAVLDKRAEELRRFLGDGLRVIDIPNGVTVRESGAGEELRQSTRRRLGLQESDVLILGVGRMTSQKRPLLFLSIAKRILGANPNARFLWIGSGKLQAEWDRKVAELDLREAVSCLPWQDSAQPYLAAADLLLHVAQFEGLAFAPLEAMAAGLPCALSDNLFEEMEFLHKRHALRVGESFDGSPELLDRANLDIYRESGRQLIQDRFSIEKMASRYLEAYSAALQRGL